MKKTLLLLFILTVVVTTSQVNALTLSTFDDKAAFLAATGATSATGDLPNLGSVGSSQTVGDIQFSSPAGLWFGTGASGVQMIDGTRIYDWAPQLDGNDIAINGIENLDAGVILDDPVFSLGFDFFEPSRHDPDEELNLNTSAAGIDSTFEVGLYMDDVLLGSFEFNAPDDIAAFVGVWTDTTFNRVTIREIEGGIGNEFFGQFYTGDAPIPEPGTMLLLGSGLIGLFALGRKKLLKK